MKKNSVVYIFSCPLLSEVDSPSVFPPERAREIEKAKSFEVKRQKYTVFRLLEKAMQIGFDTKITDTSFTKSTKWENDRFLISLSHTPQFACVAIADKRYCAYLGVDIQPIEDRLRTLYPAFCSPRELELFNSCDDDLLLACTLWTQKESVFKAIGSGAFVPKNIDTTLYRDDCVTIEPLQELKPKQVISFYSDIHDYSYTHLNLEQEL